MMVRTSESRAIARITPRTMARTTSFCRTAIWLLHGRRLGQSSVLVRLHQTRGSPMPITTEGGMTRLFRRGSRRFQSLLVRTMFLCLIACGQVGEANAKGIAMKTNEMTLWQVVEAVTRQIPFTREKIELSFSAKLKEVDQNSYTVFYTGGGVPLANGVLISTIDLRLGREVGDSYAFLSIGLSGGCVSLGDVRAHFGPLEITETPRGRSLDEKTYHTTRLAWGELSFGFAERNPSCLALIVFDPKKPE